MYRFGLGWVAKVALGPLVAHWHVLATLKTRIFQYTEKFLNLSP